MKKILYAFLVLVSTTSTATAQKVINDLNVEKRTVGSFQGIEAGTGISVMISEGNTEEVAVSASTIEFRDKIVTKVEDGILKIFYENKAKSINKKKETKDLKAYISYKNLSSLNISTGASLSINGILKSASLKINATTGAEILGAIEVAALGVKQSTGSKIKLTGTATRLDVEGDTGSMFNCIGLKTDICNAKVSTGAQVNITADKEIYAKVNTGGFVKYKGDASVREIVKSTGGYVTKTSN